MPNRKLSTWLSFLMILVLVTFPLAGCAAAGKLKSEKIEGKLTAEVTWVGSDRLALDLGAYPLAQEALCTIASVEPPAPLEGVDVRAYSFEIDTTEDLTSVLQLTLPYDADALNGQPAEGHVATAYYNPDSGAWEPVPFAINEDKQTVTIFTDHLSIYGCFEVTDENTRKAYAAYAIPALALSQMKGLDANGVIINGVANSGNPEASAVEAGLSVLDLSLALSGAALETTATIAGALGSGGGAATASLLGGMNEKLGDLGLLCSIAQVSTGMYNIYNGDTSAVFPCYANALKTGIGYTAGKLGANLFSLASLGTLAIELTLNEFAETAWSGRQDIYEKAYALYYDSKAVKRDARTWAQLFIEAKSGAATAEKYRLRIEGLVQRYAEEFWADDLVIAEYQEEAQKHGFTGGGGLNEPMKQDISNRYRDELFRTVMQDAFKLIAEKEARVAERALLKQLNAVKEELNKTCTVEFTDVTLTGEKTTSDYAGATAQIAVPETITDKSAWSTALDAEGQGQVSFTVLGYLMAGAPRSVDLFFGGSSATGSADLNVPFLAQYPTTVVELHSKDRADYPENESLTAETTASGQPAGGGNYAWVLVETITQDDQAEVEHVNSGGVYEVTASATPGSYAYSSHYAGETDDYPDPDQVNGEGYAMKLDISVPPSVIQGGEQVELTFNLAFTEQNVSYFDGNGSARADLDTTRFVNADGKGAFEIYCSLKYSEKNILSVSDTITAEAPAGGSEGDRIELWTGGPTGHLGTYYVYEWHRQ